MSLARKNKLNKAYPEIVLRNGHPTAVILDIHRYQEMLERLEDAEDLKLLQKMRKRPLHFRKFDELLKEHRWSV